MVNRPKTKSKSNSCFKHGSYYSSLPHWSDKTQ